MSSNKTLGSRMGVQFYPLILVSIYFLSGLTGIAYEVLWIRMLSLQFGVSIFGVVITVAAFLAGLGIGSLVAVRYVNQVQRPLIVFAILEGGVALFALALPLIFKTSDAWLGTVAISSSLIQWYALQGILSFVLLLFPALALGAGFPLILKALSNTRLTLARIYGLNTLGGAFGALLPLALLPALGWAHSVQFIAALGLCIAVVVCVLASFRHQHVPAIEPNKREFLAARPSSTTLWNYAVIGAAALVLEIGWTRLYGMIFLRTEYVLAIILAVFLAGIGLGSLIVRRAPGVAWLTWLPVLVAVFSLYSLWGLPILAAWLDQHPFDSLFHTLVIQGFALVILTLPTTILLGAWLPLLNNRIAQDNKMTGAWLYGVNAVGAAAGSLLAGFILIPWLGSTMTICIAALVLFAFGMTWTQSKNIWLLGLPLLLALPMSNFPESNRLLPKTQQGSRDINVYEDALNITHVIEQSDGQRLLLSDLRRMDASTDPTAVEVQKNQARLPLLLHPQPQSVLFLGLGTGISVAGALAFPGLSITVVELSQGSIRAAEQWFSAINDGIMEKVGVVRDDARRFLRADSALYDVIIGDLFHPDLVGRSNLLSIQQFARARNRLAPQGLFVQWLALNQFDSSSLSIVLRSFKQVFPNAILFVDGFRLALVGPRDEFGGARAARFNLNRLAETERMQATGGEGLWTWLGRYWGSIPASTGPVQDEWAPQIEFQLPQVRYTLESDLLVILRQLLAQRPSLDQAASNLLISLDEITEFERSFIATELAMRSWLAALRGDSNESQRLMRLGYQANNKDRWIGFDLADNMYATVNQVIQQEGRDKRSALLAILAIRPDHVETLKALWRLELRQENVALAEGYLFRLQTISPLDSDIAASVIALQD